MSKADLSKGGKGIRVVTRDPAERDRSLGRSSFDGVRLVERLEPVFWTRIRCAPGPPQSRDRRRALRALWSATGPSVAAAPIARRFWSSSKPSAVFGHTARRDVARSVLAPVLSQFDYENEDEDDCGSGPANLRPSVVNDAW